MGGAASLVLCGCGPCAVWVWLPPLCCVGVAFVLCGHGCLPCAVWVGLPPLCCVGVAASLVLCGCGCLIGTASGSPQIAHLNDSLLILKMYS